VHVRLELLAVAVPVTVLDGDEEKSVDHLVLGVRDHRK
jgi:hypothetical protein